MTRGGRAALLSIAAAGAAALVIARRRSRSLSFEEPQGLLRSLWTEVDGVSIHSRVSVGPTSGLRPVVLVHGYGVSGSYMVPIARRIAAEFPVFVPDLPGHGRSEKPERTLDVPELAQALRAWMDAVGVRRAAFLANSMGCQIVAELAVRHPERVDRLILVGPTADREARTARQQLSRLLRTGPAERQSLIPLLIADYLRARPRRIVEELEAMLADRIEEKLPRIDAPAMVVRGERDHIVPQRWAEEVARLVGADRVFVVPGAGHALNYSAADELMRLIRPFL
ncbi:MAG TPA: alpha/beta hydrolase [Thermoanaerobaculia bacterium]|nr:alpha/beta hydrolase [Thermoanaerobaculia bacterium]